MRTLYTLILLILLAGTGLYVAQRTDLISARWNPWALPDPDQPPGWLTSWQLSRLSNDTPACLDWLDRAGVEVTPVPDRAGQEAGCSLTGVATLRRSLLRYDKGVTASCPVLAGLVLYEKHVIIPAALRHFGTEPVEVQHLGTYACRPIRTPEGNSIRRSEHATANAIDIAAVKLAKGQRTVLVKDWDETESNDPAALFWRDAHAGACKIFRAALGPAYNSLHRDHFHLDMGRFSACR